MKCPYCDNTRDHVVDSRSSKEGAAIRRRRECLGCGKRFTTYEYIENFTTVVIKKDRRREPGCVREVRILEVGLGHINWLEPYKRYAYQ